jgi:uncharacterized protein (DUF1684 family)
MKKILTFALLLVLQFVVAQPKNLIEDNKEYRKKINKDFYNKEKTPLPAVDLYSFKGLPYFPIEAAFLVTAKFTRTPAEAPFMMKTTTDRTPIYIKYGHVSFSLEGKNFVLNVYQNIDFMAAAEERNLLFIPFTDLTNGKETYGGGRYLDLETPKSAEIYLDFNKAYNPYCAYNEKYSCPIPPKENHMEIRVAAGMKKYRE